MAFTKSRMEDAIRMDQEKVEKYFSLLMEEGLGLDLTDPNFRDTPKRVAKMYCQEFLESYDNEELVPNIQVFPNVGNYDQMILFDHIRFTSICPHHFLPFTGWAWIIYIPGEVLLGASKPARILSYYAARPQLQENLCHSVMNHIAKETNAKGVMVVLRGEHGCMSCRGVRQKDAGMITSAICGAFKDDLKTRTEAMNLILLSLLTQK